ncbi:MAG: tRNA (adenosine(37)-N6)-threonylcarbamoyltransferase complex transferase subunit TsaD [Bifidobacteriaceae bacterium]|nr:tRNA (adenosine(37)-N6)-threonylcarbamoyltransferase complex transferase subunit TsaD [Bifidobacteriaceae bacterium]
MGDKIVLGIESTCDETGVGILRGRHVLANAIASSMDEYARYGGIIPEIASRAHLEAIMPVINNALNTAELTLSDIDAIAVAAGPGLLGSLSVGVSAAKGLSLALDIPIYAVNHIVAHTAVSLVAHPELSLEEPLIALVASGGHSSLFFVRNFANDITELGSTLDDAAGEAFDKVGRLLGLKYPGGPEIDKLARLGNRHAIEFPKSFVSGPKFKAHRFDFSFSGVKSAVARYVEANYKDAGTGKIQISEQKLQDIAASFSEAVTDVLVTKTLDAAREYGVRKVFIGGGFSANSDLRAKFKNAEVESKYSDCPLEIFIPPTEYCTDNGIMIACLGAILLENHVLPSPLDFTIDSVMSVG